MVAKAAPRIEEVAEAAAWRALAGVQDPEIPVLSIVDLGIVRYVHRNERGTLQVGITPTYSGCPATEVICALVKGALAREGFDDAIIDTVLSPPWSSDWLSEAGREKLRAYGIAPPAESVSSARRLLGSPPSVACPRCASRATQRVSEFGSTPCKAHYRCTTCLEPFDYFKCL